MNDKPDLAALFGATKTDTFLGLEKCENLEALSAPVALISALGATPYGSVGAYCRNAPDALRKATGALASNIDRHNFDLGGPTFPTQVTRAVDCGNLPFDDQDFAINRDTIHNAISTILTKSAVPVLIGGDDSVPIPMLEALGTTGDHYTVLQLDAHIDWRQEHMGEDMGLSSTMRRASEMDHIERIIQVGARSIGSGHSDDLADAVAWGAQFVPAHDLHRDGVQAVLDLIPAGSNVVICLDVDVLDPSIVPGVIGRAPGGLSYFQCLDLIRGTANKARIAAIDFVEYMPEADIGDLGALTVSRLIASTLGLLARQAT
ncbi:arginase family protein [uncultured Shimia sp.]|uniref:arginase family protein n=1 Tax=uncultured Shimia sp. TaxID=573152 RepID=UPI00260AB7F2|nr:arginase family protein [uncultured Shimia sp.]